MSHEIEENDRQDGLEQAWHGLTNIKPDLSLKDNWLREWEAVPFSLVADDNAKTKSKFSCFMASDIPGLIIGQPFNPASYKAVFNAEFLKIAETLVAKYPGCIVESVGSLRNRARVFISLRLPKDSGGTFVAGGREFRGFFNLLNSFDFSCPIMGTGSNICVVCNNTFSAAMAQGFADDDSCAAIGRHKKGLNLDALTKMMEEAIGAQLGFKEEFDKLAARSISIEQAQWAFAGFVGDRRAALTSRSNGIVEELDALFRKGKGNNGQTHADWFSAVTDYYTHQNATSKADSAGKAKQWLSSEFGTGAKTKAAAWFAITNDERMEKMMADGKDLLRAYNEGKEKAKSAKR